MTRSRARRDAESLPLLRKMPNSNMGAMTAAAKAKRAGKKGSGGRKISKAQKAAESASDHGHKGGKGRAKGKGKGKASERHAANGRLGKAAQMSGSVKHVTPTSDDVAARAEPHHDPAADGAHAEEAQRWKRLRGHRRQLAPTLTLHRLPRVERGHTELRSLRSDRAAQLIRINNIIGS